jgi:hypothetical protein
MAQGEKEPDMPYLRKPDRQPLTAEEVKTLAAAAGVDIPDEDLQPLAEALTSQLAAIAVFERFDISRPGPSAAFDPRWQNEEQSQP